MEVFRDDADEGVEIGEVKGHFRWSSWDLVFERRYDMCLQSMSWLPALRNSVNITIPLCKAMHFSSISLHLICRCIL